MKFKELFIIFFLAICVNQVLTRSAINEENNQVSQIDDEQEKELIRVRREVDESDENESNDDEADNDDESDENDENDAAGKKKTNKKKGGKDKVAQVKNKDKFLADPKKKNKNKKVNKANCSQCKCKGKKYVPCIMRSRALKTNLRQKTTGLAGINAGCNLCAQNSAAAGGGMVSSSFQSTSTSHKTTKFEMNDEDEENDGDNNDEGDKNDGDEEDVVIDIKINGDHGSSGHSSSNSRISTSNKEVNTGLSNIPKQMKFCDEISDLADEDDEDDESDENEGEEDDEEDNDDNGDNSE